jgi:hypothetical protein
MKLESSGYTVQFQGMCLEQDAFGHDGSAGVSHEFAVFAKDEHVNRGCDDLLTHCQQQDNPKTRLRSHRHRRFQDAQIDTSVTGNDL